MSVYRYIEKHGNVGYHHKGVSKSVLDGKIVCKDGFTMVVRAGQDMPNIPSVTPCDESCNHPKEDPHYDRPCNYSGPYDNLFVEYVSEVPPNFSRWMVYGYAGAPKGAYYRVPKEMIKELIEYHGGELGG